MKTIFFILMIAANISYSQFSIPKEIRKLNNPVIYTAAEVQAEFPGGIKEMYKFISKNLKYPTSAQRANVSGKVFIRFVVEHNGSLSEITVLKGIGFGCDEEAYRIFKSMPIWTPAKIKGKSVRCYFTTPVSFVLD